MSTTIRNWVIKDLAPAIAGDNTIISGSTKVRYMIKRLILMCDSATDIYFKSSGGKKRTSTFYFPHVGGTDQIDQLNIVFASGNDIVLNSSNAANISMMLDIQRLPE